MNQCKDCSRGIEAKAGGRRIGGGIRVGRKGSRENEMQEKKSVS